ncbi:PREDICTED: isochorismatase domain-containing protein 2-like [Dufourea novaeangliae]|uniref:Isochorismatase domain-containing protein 1 n=1 Tax=Dufourea novaeangliae TaxID=178035 RepID=A0A154P5F9_DUFNO|nr:PREDICTED: isochorismatase domain-containing protein 2-like [Dufourea novaeangliae]KZC07117.1 Isochorismatase domain-containing protein 2, mitochondrial [Dufourea novaeangliae]
MVMNAARAILKQGKSALLICDVQEKFAKAMLEFDKVTQNSVKLIDALKLLEVPILVSEQNPNALGKTIPAFDISGAKGPFPKTQFSMCTPEITKELCTICSGQKPEAIILIGLETHVCIENTAIDLRQNGYEVHTVADCCTSRTQEDRLLALERMRGIGCHITTSENVIFKLLADANHKEFKNIQRLVKTPTLPTGLTSKI